MIKQIVKRILCRLDMHSCVYMYSGYNPLNVCKWCKRISSDDGGYYVDELYRQKYVERIISDAKKRHEEAKGRAT